MASANYERDSLFSVEKLVVVISGGGRHSNPSTMPSQSMLTANRIGPWRSHCPRAGCECIGTHDWLEAETDLVQSNGAKAVYILGRRREALEKVAKAAKNGSIKPIVADVTSKEDLERAANDVRKEHGYINVLFANSGIIGPYIADLYVDGKKPDVDTLQKKLWSFEPSEFTNAFHVNVTGAFYTFVAFLDLLDEGNKRRVVPQTSQVIVTSSIAAFSRVPSGGFAYTASKAAVIQLVKQLSTCCSHLKIRLNAIAPGIYPSEMTGKMPFMQGDDPRNEGSVVKEICPAERSGSEEDIGGLALFLASRAGAYINGSIHLTDGGRLGLFPATY